MHTQAHTTHTSTHTPVHTHTELCIAFNDTAALLHTTKLLGGTGFLYSSTVAERNSI